MMRLRAVGLGVVAALVVLMAGSYAAQTIAAIIGSDEAINGC
jgi:hypothetical protein